MYYIADFTEEKTKKDFADERGISPRPSSRGALVGASLGVTGGNFVGGLPGAVVGVGAGSTLGYIIGKSFKEKKNKRYDF